MSAPIYPHLSFTADATFTAAHRTLDTLMRALRAHHHVMMTPPDGKYGYEVSLSVDDVMHHGEHPTDPMCALLIALAKYEAGPPRPESA
jgi:hypothetical protein